MINQEELAKTISFVHCIKIMKLLILLINGLVYNVL